MGFFDNISDMEFGKSYYELAGIVKDEIQDVWQEKKSELSESTKESHTIMEEMRDDLF